MTKERRVARRQSSTAEINAAQRAGESLQPPERRLLDDPFARYFVAHPGYRALVAGPRVAWLTSRMLDRWAPGLHVHILLRVRYATDAVQEAVGAGVDQVVLLGAGFDSTAFRLDGPRVTVYEVDSPPTQQAKRERVERHGLEPRHRLVWVPCDFERDSARERLMQSGFAAARPCVIVWLGVSMYLTRDAFDHALGEAGSLSAAGSLLVLDYIDRPVVDGTTQHVGARRMRRSVERRGEPYRLGFDRADLPAVAREHGYEIRDHVRAQELAARYGGVWCSTDEWIGLLTAERVS